MTGTPRVLVTGAVVVGLAVVGALPPVRRGLGRLLLRTTGTVVRTERPDDRRTLP